ncbi:hypothetical protein T4B_7434 [Trichinella pseudospiralis]|uniref:Uncharacterized protein n=2 Tax=Trichinella pseudospiralis TaxID=6337 RepID=A0A0V1EWY4_TRIPS|nr:hypothetical protein T4A_9340 [Trichinella pseudospiralis]KRZ34074.1 hypothetical protein T4B_7434 [Trichinella pseudospiralis]
MSLRPHATVISDDDKPQLELYPVSWYLKIRAEQMSRHIQMLDADIQAKKIWLYVMYSLFLQMSSVSSILRRECNARLICQIYDAPFVTDSFYKAGMRAVFQPTRSSVYSIYNCLPFGREEDETKAFCLAPGTFVSALDFDKVSKVSGVSANRQYRLIGEKKKENLDAQH